MSNNSKPETKNREAAEAETIPADATQQVIELQEALSKLQKENEKYVAWINRLKGQITSLETELMEALYGSQS